MIHHFLRNTRQRSLNDGRRQTEDLPDERESLEGREERIEPGMQLSCIQAAKGLAKGQVPDHVSRQKIDPFRDIDNATILG